MSVFIDPELPLPSNTKYSWDECFAKLILERFCNLKNLDLLDKPDLQNSELGVGIEVTTAVDEKSQELDSLYTNLSYNRVRNINGTIKKVNELGGNISNGILSHPINFRTLNNIYKSFKIKVELLNVGKYTIFNHNCVFIFDQNLIVEEELFKMIACFNMIQNNLKYKFEKVYMYIYGYKLFELDLNKKKYIVYGLLESDVFNVSIDARKLVEEKEIEDISSK